mgnify:CR=1 FL=1
MKIHSAKFLMSNPTYERCPKEDMPEYAFIGRSNVGKSSLINMLVNQKGLAKTSGKPGKTQLINHFTINDEWYLVDLPGYGWAKVGKKMRDKFEELIEGYLFNRKNLMCTFVLIDIRHKPQKIDIEFMDWMGENELPFVIVFTKADKLPKTKAQKAVHAYQNEMLKHWAGMPEIFITSSEKEQGKDEIFDFVEETNPSFKEILD